MDGHAAVLLHELERWLLEFQREDYTPLI